MTFVVIGLLLLQLPQIAEARIAEENVPRIADVAWMTGCWEQREADTVIHETWMQPLGGTMLGMNRTVNHAKTVEFEFLRIEEKEGKLAYIAKPSTQKEVTFIHRELSPTRVVFCNPDHDFPRIITYELLGADVLQASIEGPIQGKTKRITFTLTRIPCHKVDAKTEGH